MKISELTYTIPTTEVKFRDATVNVKHSISANEKATLIQIALDASAIETDAGSAGAYARTTYSRLMFEELLLGMMAKYYAELDIEIDDEDMDVFEAIKHSGLRDAILNAVPKTEVKEFREYADDAFERATAEAISGAKVLENFLLESLKSTMLLSSTQEQVKSSSSKS